MRPAIHTHLSQLLQPILHGRCQHLQHLQSGQWQEWKRVLLPLPSARLPPSLTQTSAQRAHRVAVQPDTVGVQELQHCQEGLSGHGA